jgi:TonB family protein
MIAITHALSAALLHFVWQGLAITILCWLALFFLRKSSAPLRYAVSCGSLVMLVLLPAVTTWALYERPAAGLPSRGVLAEAFGVSISMPSAGGVNWLGLAESWALPVWCCGVFIFSLRMIWGCAQVAALRRAGTTADAVLAAAFDRLAQRMGLARPVRLLLSPVSDSPSVTGWWKPVVLLPFSAVAGLTPEQLEAVLAHELAHILRHDYLVNLLQMAAETLLFYHPAVWWISRRIRHERELCCDDLAVQACGGALSYARALTALEKMRASRPALALGSTDGPLFFRVKRLVAGGTEYGPSKLSGTVALALGVACLALVVNWARAQEPARRAATQDRAGVTVNTAGAVVLHRTIVDYPEELRAKGVQGTVSVEVILDNAGQVADARVLSGPTELRRTALSSVLNWHFAAQTAGSRVVEITFQPPAEPVAHEEHSQTPSEGSRGWAFVTTDDKGNARTSTVRADIERQQAAERLLEAEQRVIELREQIAAAQNDSGANASNLEKLQRQLAERMAETHNAQRELGNAQVDVQNREQRRQIEMAEKEMLAARQRSENPELAARSEVDARALRSSLEDLERLTQLRSESISGKPVIRIEFRGLSEDAVNTLLPRLPIHTGDTLSDSSREAISRALRDYDRHLEFNYNIEPDGVILRVHVAGTAGSNDVIRK